MLSIARARGTPPASAEAPFGAAGGRGADIDRELVAAVTAARKARGADPRFGLGVADPMTRMFETEVGQRSASEVGSESRTLEAVHRIALEVMAQALRSSGQVAEDDRLLVMPEGDGGPPVLMLMSPRLENPEESRYVSDEMDLPLPVLMAGVQEAADAAADSPEGAVFRHLLEGGAPAIAELFLISQPAVVLTRRPRMVRLCVPSPRLNVEADGVLSTAGILCVDAEGDFGVTACYHGTGPIGTPVLVAGETSSVKDASEVQDTVFIPLSNRGVAAGMVGVTGVRDIRAPAPSDPAQFDGAVNQNCSTRIFSTDAGLLRARPTIMLKVQTDPDTDQGDSGCALRDELDRVLGFAFERTAYDDHPQFTDWIWAANALRALNLTPYAGA